MTIVRFILSSTLLVGACISVPEGPDAMCKKTSDCESGEVCEEGTCWGNPPTGTFAAVLSPPTTRHDLVPVEFSLELPQDGWMGDLTLPAPAMIAGKIIAFCPPPMTNCDTGTLPATVTITRRSAFHGGPGFKTAIPVAAGADSFEMPVPGGNEPYTVTIVPDGRGDSPSSSGGRTAAELVPPLQLEMTTDSPGIHTFALGGADLPVISGTLTNSLGQGLAMYRVVAIGRWDPSQSPVEVSTVDYTDTTGQYSLTLSDGLVGSIEIVAKPYGSTLAPTIHMANIDATKSSTNNVVMPTNVGHETLVSILVQGVDKSGTISPVRGAQVSLGGLAQGSASTTFTIGDTEVTDDTGHAQLHVLDGAAYVATYKLSIVPPASSSLGVIYDQKVMLGAIGSMRLPARVALSGKLRDASGHTLGGVSVTARPSLRFLWTLDVAPQTFVAAIPAATTVTPDSGDFVVWVDPLIAQTVAHYDLVFEPPAGARAPSSTLAEVEIRTDTADTGVSVGDLNLPDAAFVHGDIVDPIGELLEGAELKLYRVTTDLALCGQVTHAPASCPIPAQLQGRNTSDAAGTVRLTLPR